MPFSLKKRISTKSITESNIISQSNSIADTHYKKYSNLPTATYYIQLLKAIYYAIKLQSN